MPFIYAANGVIWSGVIPATSIPEPIIPIWNAIQSEIKNVATGAAVESSM